MIKQRFFTFFISGLLLLILSNCKNNNKETLLEICNTTNTKFSAVIYPIIVSHCNTASGCHGGSSMGSISLEGYNNINNNYSSILSRIKSGNMPKGQSKLDDCTISKIETWINNGHQNN